MKVLVMGAGLAGVTTAWQLAREGHEVTVLDREPEVAAAASRANGGIVASSRPFPWPGPHMLGPFLKALWRNDQAVRLRLQLDPYFWRWGLQFMGNCSAARYAEILGHKARLVHYSQQCLQALVAAADLRYHRLTNGVLYVYRNEAALEKAWARSALVRDMGIATERLAPAQVTALEPGMDAGRIAGALYAPGDEAGDSALFCRELAQRCEGLGVRFALGTAIVAVDASGERVDGIVTASGTLRADAYVCALGAVEPALRRKFGVDLAVYPVKGYSTTGTIVDPARAPRRAGMDESRLIAYCPMGDRLRITGGAEFAGYARSSAPGDFTRMHRAFEEIFPGAADFSAASTWACQRPMTPESTPRFGHGRYRNLWFNMGQGHMGWAMAAGSARITADLVCGRAAGISLAGLLVTI